MFRNFIRHILEWILGWKRAWDFLRRFEDGGVTFKMSPEGLKRCPVPLTVPLDSLTGVVGIEPHIEWLSLGNITVYGLPNEFVNVHFEKAVAMFVEGGIGLVVHRDADLEEVGRWLETVVWPRARARQADVKTAVEETR